MGAILDAIQKFIEESLPALAVLLWNFEESKVNEEKHKTLDAQVNLELEKNHEEINTKYANSSDLDVINDAISECNRGQSETDSPTEPNAATSGDPKR